MTTFDDALAAAARQCGVAVDIELQTRRRAGGFETPMRTMTSSFE
jgi:hypothetical protein